jgi:DNA-binding GntR family transcriptional regulator
VPGQGGQGRDLETDTAVPAQRAAGGVLADRMAAALVHREPGWQLPRRSALARRYNVSMAEIDVAIGELTRRSLVRRLPDGQLYRASAAEYLIPVEGIGGLSTRLDPMGGEISCTARHVSLRPAPQDVAWSLGVAGQLPVRIVRCAWSIGAEPVAISTAYVPGAASGADAGEPDAFEATLQLPPGSLAVPGTVRARAVDLELAPPQSSVARSLRLPPGEPTILVTIRFDDCDTGAPAGLTTVALKPQHFRVVIQAGDPLPGPAGAADLPKSPVSAETARRGLHRQLSTRRVHTWQPRVHEGLDDARERPAAAAGPPPDPGGAAPPP